MQRTISIPGMGHLLWSLDETRVCGWGTGLETWKSLQILGLKFLPMSLGSYHEGKKRWKSGLVTCDSGSHLLGKTWRKEIKQKISSCLLSPLNVAVGIYSWKSGFNPQYYVKVFELAIVYHQYYAGSRYFQLPIPTFTPSKVGSVSAIFHCKSGQITKTWTKPFSHRKKMFPDLVLLLLAVEQSSSSSSSLSQGFTEDGLQEKLGLWGPGLVVRNLTLKRPHKKWAGLWIVFCLHPILQEILGEFIMPRPKTI